MMNSHIKRFIAGLSCITLLSSNISVATEVLQDSGQRQTVVERTKQYAGQTDAAKIRINAANTFQAELKSGTSSLSTLEGQNSQCGSFTTSPCGIACCGEEECKAVCTANRTYAHGKETCLEAETTSWCGMSCCGKQDCDNVCMNYRPLADLPNDKCNGYTVTATGAACCGFTDCQNKSCNGQTSTTRVDDGEVVECCGEQNCKDIKCDYNHSTEDIDGKVVSCCGVKDCYSKYCKGQTSVDSKVNDQKDIACCGPIDCHNKECDNYVITQTPTGQVACCGYEDCHLKECGNRISTTDMKGNTIVCCGVKDCNDKFAATLTPLYFGSSMTANGGKKQTISLASIRNNDQISSATVHCFLGNAKGEILVNDKVVWTGTWTGTWLTYKVDYTIPINENNYNAAISIKGYIPYLGYVGLWGFGDNAWTGEKCELKLSFKQN